MIRYYDRELEYYSIAHLLYPEELRHTASPVGVHPASQRRELTGFDSVGVGIDIVQEVDGLAVRVTTDDDVLHVVEDAGQLEHGGFCGHTVGRDQRAATMNDISHFVWTAAFLCFCG